MSNLSGACRLSTSSPSASSRAPEAGTLAQPAGSNQPAVTDTVLAPGHLYWHQVNGVIHVASMTWLVWPFSDERPDKLDIALEKTFVALIFNGGRTGPVPPISSPLPPKALQYSCALMQAPPRTPLELTFILMAALILLSSLIATNQWFWAVAVTVLVAGVFIPVPSLPRFVCCCDV